jgi:CCR4-NOT transcription complex subunit 7/8
MFFEDNIDDGKYCGHLFGLGTSYVQNGSAYESHTNNQAYPAGQGNVTNGGDAVATTTTSS